MDEQARPTAPAQERSERPRRFDILERRRVHDGFFALDLLRLRHERFDGGWSAELKRELFVQPQAVVVLPYDPVQDRVVLVEQFRTGAVDHPGGPWLLEAPAGLVDKEGETLEEVARRELREECGLAAGQVERAVTYVPSPGGTSEIATVFVAEVNAPAEGAIHGEADEHEDILNHVVPAETAFRWLHEGRIRAATAVVALLYLQVHRERLRRAWRSVAPTGA